MFTASRTDEKFLRKGRSTYPINGPNPSHQQPENWWVSVDLGGSPGLSDASPLTESAKTSNVLLDPLKTSRSKLSMEFLALNLLASLRTDDVTIVIEVSEDLKT